MTICAALVLLVVAATSPSGLSPPASAPRARNKTGQAPPPTSLPMPPPPVLKPAAAARQKEAPGEAKGGLPPLTLGAVLGPAFSLSGAPASIPGAGTPASARLVAHGTLAVLKLGPADIDVGVALGFQQFSIPGTAGWSNFGFDLLPAGRASFRLLDRLSVYGELGLGLVMYRTSGQVMYIGYQSFGANGVGFRLGGGLAYALSDQFGLVLEPVGLLVVNTTTSVTVGGQTVTASGTGSQLSVSLGVTYRL